MCGGDGLVQAKIRRTLPLPSRAHKQLEEVDANTDEGWIPRQDGKIAEKVGQRL